MDNVQLTSALEVAIFGLAIAQVLTILLTFRRERDVKDLRELVDEQRLHLAELRAWLAGRNALQTRRIASERDPEPKANAKASESGMPQETGQPSTSEDDVARATKTLEWQREVAANLRSAIRAEIPQTEQATAPADKKRSSIAEDAFKWFKDDPNEPREMVEAREIVADLGKTSHRGAQAQDSPESLSIQPSSTAHDDLEKTNRAIKWLKEDIDKSSEITSLKGKPSVDLK